MRENEKCSVERSSKDLIQFFIDERMAASTSNRLSSWINQGRVLYDIKSQLVHGDFIPWINKNVPYGDRQSQNYMRIYRYGSLLRKNISKIKNFKDAMYIIKEYRKSELNR